MAVAPACDTGRLCSRGPCAGQTTRRGRGMGERRVRFGIIVAQMTGTYEGIRDAWLAVDRLDPPS